MPILVVPPPAPVEQQPLTPAPAGSPVHTADAPPSLETDSHVPLATPAALPDEGHVEHGPTLPGLTLPRQPIAVLSSDRAHRNATIRVQKVSIGRRIVLGSTAALLVVVISLGLRLFTRKPAHVSDQRAVPTASVRSAATPVSTSDAVTVPTQMRLAAVASTTTAASERTSVAPPSVNGQTPASDSPLPQSPNVLAGEGAIPDYVSKPALLHLGSIAIRRAQRCHPHGHAVGSARVLVTFAPNGRVSDARIEGEPLSSAPVSSCILGHAHAIRIPKFNGAPFTYTLPITMR